MIIRILSEGQYDVPDDEVDGLNILDENLEHAVDSDDEKEFSAALEALLSKVRTVGTPVPLEDIVESDLLLPFGDASVEEVRELLGDEGLIPGRSGSHRPPPTAEGTKAEGTKAARRTSCTVGIRLRGRGRTHHGEDSVSHR